MTTRWKRAILIVIPVLGVAAVVGGGALLRATGPIGFGWSAYAPLTGAAFTPAPAPWWTVGVVAVLVGVAVVAGWAGYLLGSRRGPTRTPAPDADEPPSA